MTAKPVIPRARAHADVDVAVEYYADEAGADVAVGFIDALEQAYTFIGEMPAAGSTRWAHELNLPGLMLMLSREGSEVRLRADGDATVLVLTGEPIDEPVVGYGPFVMNSEAEIQQAIADFNSGKFAQAA